MAKSETKQPPQSLYDLAGGAEMMQRLAAAFYRRVFADPVMIPLFHDLTEDHVGRMALFLGEHFGGHTDHTQQRGGFSTMISVHHALDISDVQRNHWITHMLAACDEVALPQPVMDHFEPFIHFGARAAQGSPRRSRFGF
jgi:hemoglobin